MRVLVLCPYPLRTAPSQRFRFEQYIEPLRSRGVDLDVRPLVTEADLEVLHARGRPAHKAKSLLSGAARRLSEIGRSRSYDLVFVHREAFAAGPAIFERMLSRLGVPYVIDFDDAIWLPNSSDANRMVEPLKFNGKLRSIVRHAALVVAGNEYLADWARPHNPNVRVIPTTIDTALYTPRAKPSNGAICIGWSGSRTTAQHLEQIGPVLKEIQIRTGARLLVVGPDQDFGIPGVEMSVRPWREATELDDLAEMDIGVMPLPDDEWARGKCGLKALQYMAMGVATVMSPVGVNARIAEGGAAVLASTPPDWVEALERLLSDSAARDQVGRAGRERVEQRYSVEVNVPLYEEVCTTAARRPRRG